MNLSDNYVCSGTSFEDFKQELSSIVDNSETLKIKSYNFYKFLSFQAIEGDNYTFTLIDESSINKFNSFVSPLPKVSFCPNSEEKKFFDECVQSSGLLLLDDSKQDPVLILISKNAIPSLADRAGVGGDLINNSSLIRNLYLAQGLFIPWERTSIEKINTTVILRKQLISHGKVLKKAFAFMGNKFIYPSLNNMVELSEAILQKHPLKNGKCYKWKISHKESHIFIEFPEKGKELSQKYNLKDVFIPGIQILDSDIGRQAFCIKFTYRLENSDTLCIYDTKSWKHTSKINLEEVLDYVFNVFTNTIEELPLSLENLSCEHIKIGRASAIYKEKIKNAQLVKAIGKKRTMALIDALEKMPVPDTEYDVVTNIIKTGDAFEMPDYAKILFSETLGRIIFTRKKDLLVKWED